MQVATIDAPHSATGTDAVTNLIDRTTLQSFIIANSITLTDAAHEAGKYRLFYTTPEAILGKLTGNLHRYGGPIEESDFIKWATHFVAKEAARYEITGRIVEEYSDLIHKAIHESLWTSAYDESVEHQDIYWEIIYLIFQNAHSLNRRGKAKLSTRLWALVDKHIYLYHNKRNADRKKAVRLRRNEIGCEYLSEEELAAMRADAKDNAVYDPGYADAGLSMA